MYVEEAGRGDGGDVTVSLAVEGLDKYFRSAATKFFCHRATSPGRKFVFLVGQSA